MSIVIITEDKFKGVTYYKSERAIQMRSDGPNKTLIYPEFIKIPNPDEVETSSSMDEDNFSYNHQSSTARVIVELTHTEWWFLNRGSLIFLINGKAINLGKPVSRRSYTDKVRVNNKDFVVCVEKCVYLMSNEQLKNICDASQVEVQLSGERWKEEVTFDQVNLDYFRCIYNAAIDSNAYTDRVAKFESYSNRSFANKGLGVGLGCVIPVALFLIVAFGAFGIDYEKNIIWAFLPFIIALMGGLIYYFRQETIRSKANK